MTRWHLINLPVYVTGAPEPTAAVEAVWVDWQARRVQALVVGGSVFGVRAVEYGDGVRVEPDGVRLRHWSLVRRFPRRMAAMAANGDWQGRPVVDAATRRLMGRVKDLEFDPTSGNIQALWISRGILADLWHGMALSPIAQAQPDGDRIVVDFPGHV